MNFDLDIEEEEEEPTYPSVTRPVDPLAGFVGITSDWGLEWTEYGACGDYEKEVFFPSEEDPETGARRSGASWVKANAKAKLICAGCMVKNQCLWFALDNNEQFGVWGGHTFEERRTLKRFSNWEGLRADAEAEADAIASQTTAA